MRIELEATLQTLAALRKDLRIIQKETGVCSLDLIDCVDDLYRLSAAIRMSEGLAKPRIGEGD